MLAIERCRRVFVATLACAPIEAIDAAAKRQAYWNLAD
jgi:hypothetical protein